MKDTYSVHVRIYAMLLFVCICSVGNAQNIFQKLVSISNYVAGCDIEHTSDGGYIISGSGSVALNNAGSSLIKIDSTGDTLWTAIYADSIYASEETWVAKQTFDGGYITAGGHDGGTDDIFLRKTDALGNETWKRSYNDVGMSNEIYGVEQMADSGYAFLHSWVGGYLSRTDKNGNLLWSQAYYNASVLKTLTRTNDGGFIMTGWGYDTVQALIVIKTDSLGNEQWQKLYGTNTDGNYVEQTADGGYIVTGNASFVSPGNGQVLLMKLNASGIEQWSKTYYILNQEFGVEVHQTSDGGYIVAGTGAAVSGNGQMLLMKTDASGNIQWNKLYGNATTISYFKTNLSVKIAADGGYVCTSAGFVPSWGNGTYIVKTDAAGNTSCNESSPVMTVLNSPQTERSMPGVGALTLNTVTNTPMDMFRGGSTRNICLNADVGSHHFWVTAARGGYNSSGTILKSDSLGEQWELAQSFINFQGAWPNGDLVMAGNGKIYGVCQAGGYANSCTLYDLDTANDVITKHHDFALVYSDGDEPLSGLMVGSDCKLYGAAWVGGPDSSGVIYSFNTTTNTYSDVYNFVRATGARPSSELIQLPNGKLYGVAQFGGLYNDGVIFSFDPSTSTYADIHDFETATGDGIDRNTPFYASDGYIYGTTYYGGTSNGGVIYRLDPATNAYTVLHDFSYYDGIVPWGRLAYYNGKLYGTTQQGGSVSRGTLYSYDIAADTLIVRVNFNGTNGAKPVRGLKLSSYGTLFGTTPEGGANGFGVIFRFNPVTNIYKKVFDFDSATTGMHPDCDVMELGFGINPCIILDVPVQEEASAFSLYPNPTSGSFTISAKEEIEGVEIFNAIGEKVYARKSAAKQLEITNSLRPGIYFARIHTAGGFVAQKFIVE